MAATDDEQLQDEIQDVKNNNDAETLCINLRGSKFTVNSKHLTRHPSSLLCQKYEEELRKEERGGGGQGGGAGGEGGIELYFDHNPALFHHVWDAYIGAGGMHVPRTYCTRYVEQELLYWGLEADRVLEPCCWDKLMEGQDSAHTLADVVKEWEKGDILIKNADTLTHRQRMHLFLEEPRTSKGARAYTCFIMLVAIGSIITWLLESVPSCRFIIDGKEELIKNASKHMVDTYLRYSLPTPYLWYLDIVAAFVLATDYVLRLLASPARWRFVINFLNVADIMGLIPIIIMISMEFYQLHNDVNDDFLHAMYVLNILRVLRVLRMFRMIQHYKPLKVVFWAWKASYQELLLLLIIISVSACVFGSLIFYIELYEDQIFTIPHGMWWAIITMTTVGYGDVVPVTPAGCVVGCLCAITGILAISMPVPVIVQNCSKYYSAVQTVCRSRKQGKDLITAQRDSLNKSASLSTQSSSLSTSSSGIGPHSSGISTQSSSIGPQNSGMSTQSSSLSTSSSGIGPQSSGIGPQKSGIGPQSSGIGPQSDSLNTLTVTQHI